MSKVSEISLLLTSKENETLHIFGMSETKLKIISCQELLTLEVFRHLSGRTIKRMTVEIYLYMLEIILMPRGREDLETNAISCLRL